MDKNLDFYFYDNKIIYLFQTNLTEEKLAEQLDETQRELFERKFQGEHYSEEKIFCKGSFENKICTQLLVKMSKAFCF